MAEKEIIREVNLMQEEPSIPDIVDEHFHEMLEEEPVSDAEEKGVELWSEEDEDNFEDEFAKYLAQLKAALPHGKRRLSDMVLYRLALHFSGWKKRNMMKCAVECEVRDDGTDMFTTETWEQMSDYLRKKKFKFGDKVKVIIIKEDRI